jgi:hypothetical protein
MIRSKVAAVKIFELARKLFRNMLLLQIVTAGKASDWTTSSFVDIVVWLSKSFRIWFTKISTMRPIPVASVRNHNNLRETKEQ